MRKLILILFLAPYICFAQLPDFVIISVQGPTLAIPGETVQVTVKARNQGIRGNQQGTFVRLRMILSPDTQINLGDNLYADQDSPINNWANGAIVTVTYSYTIPNNLNGTYYWGAYVDSPQYWNESNENNNALAGNTVGISSRPDFIIMSVSGPSSASACGTVQVTITVRNQGGRGNQTDGTYVRLRMILSPDAQINLADNMYYQPESYGDISITQLASNGATITKTFNYTIQNNLNGNFYWGAYIDSPQYWNESNENNNALAGNSVSISCKPTIVSPYQNQYFTNPKIYFEWTSLACAVKYELYVDNDGSYDVNGDFKSPEVSPKIMRGFENITSTNIYVPANWLEPNRTYYAHIIAKYADGTSCKSDKISFYYAPNISQSPNWTPLFRAYSSMYADHYYCSEKDHLDTAIAKGYVFEGNEGFISSVPFETSLGNSLEPIYRFFMDTDNPNYKTKLRHYYVISSASRDDLINRGYTYEGIVGYTYKNYIDGKGLVRLFHSYKNTPTIIDNFYTTSFSEYKNSLNRFGYTDITINGFLFYVSKYGENQDLNPVDYKVSLGLINAFTGGVTHSESCFSIPVGILSLNFGINYSSVACMLQNDNISLGYGWSHNYSAYLKINDNDITVYWSGGRFHEYPKPSNNNTEISPTTKGVYDRLIKVSESEYKIKTKDQTIIKFQKLNSTDNAALLKSITDRKGNTLTCYYDNYFRLTEVAVPDNTSAFKKSLLFTYDNSVTSINDRSKLIKDVIDNSLGTQRKVSFEYDANSNLTKYTDVMGKVSTYQYETNNTLIQAHLLKEITLPENKKITNSFVNDIAKLGKNPVSKQIIGQGANTTSIGFSKTTDAASVTTSTITTKLISSSAVTTYAVISSGQIPGLPVNILKNGNTYTNYEYADSIRNPTLPTKITDGRTNVTTITYDNMGNTKIISKPLGETHFFNYNSTNDVTDYRNPRNMVSNYIYDNSNGNLIKIITPRGDNQKCTTTVNYNTVGLRNGTVSSVIDPLGWTTAFSYNDYGMKSKIIDPMGHVTNFDIYDGANRLKQITQVNLQNGSQKDQRTIYEYLNNDLIQRVSNTIDSRSISTQYEYDGNKNLTKVTDARGNSTQMFYQNEKNLLDRTTNQIGLTTRYQYYDNGLTKQITKPNGSTINYEYDELFHLSRTSFGSNSYQYTYDKNDNLLRISDNQNGDIRFDNNNGNNYDALDRLKSYTDFYGNTVSYEYDVNSNITKIIYPNGKSVDYTYYDDDLLKTVNWDGKLIATYSYRNDGSIDKIVYGNNTKTQYTYDAAGRLIELSNTKSNGETINSYTYTLDNVGNQTKVSQIEPLAGMPIHSSTTTGTYDAANRDNNLNFDPNGNQIKGSNPNGNTYSFDALNRLTSISESNTSFVYDASGNRRAKTVNGVTTKYILDINSSMSQVLVEKNENTNEQWNYIYGAGLIARINLKDSLYYYHTDSRGSVVAMTDKNQDITHKYAYNEFGEVTNKVEPLGNSNPFRYVGSYGVIDDGNGLYYMRARYYHVATGRFVSEDPKWATNLYWYADGNPVMSIDPEGLTSTKNNWKKIQNMQEDVYAYELNAINAEAEADILEGFINAIDGVYKLKDGDIIGSLISTSKNIGLIVKYGTNNQKIVNNVNNTIKILELIDEVLSIHKDIKEVNSVFKNRISKVKNPVNYLKKVNKNPGKYQPVVNVTEIIVKKSMSLFGNMFHK